jgi:hypothetical protein
VSGASDANLAIGMAEVGNHAYDFPIQHSGAASGRENSATGYRCDLINVWDAGIAQTDNLDRQSAAVQSVVDDASMALGAVAILKRAAVAGVRGGARLSASALTRVLRGGSAAGSSSGKALATKAVGDVCPGLNCPCFVAGTLIDTASGSVPIEQIVVGDVVTAWDEKTGAWTTAPVVRLFETPNKATMRVELNGDDVTEVIEATPGHPWWVDGRGWTPTAELSVGDSIPSAHGGWLRVGSNTWAQTSTTVYNFEVEGLHTYAVGEGAALVHNTCGQTIYGVHWTSAADAESIITSGSLNASYNNLLWFETATSRSQLSALLSRSQQAVRGSTGAASAQVALIVDISSLGRQVGKDVVFRQGSLLNPVGGGVAVLGPSIQLNRAAGLGVHWYTHTGVRSHVKTVVNAVFNGRRVFR